MIDFINGFLGTQMQYYPFLSAVLGLFMGCFIWFMLYSIIALMFGVKK